VFGAGEKKPGFLDRLKQAVASTKAQLVERLETITEGKTAIDQGVLDALEATLITADLGVGTTEEILTRLKAQVKAQKLREPRQLRAAVEQEVLRLLEDPGCAGRPAGDRLRRPAGPSEPAKPHAGEPARRGGPEVIFVVGVNGVGKTTSIAKLAHYYLQQNRRPLLAAADTFRAAANEQLEIWAGRLGIQIVMQKPGADPAAVLFDALASAKKRNDDPVIVDTAGRLHTKDNLMAELEKMCRIAGREVAGAPHQVLLVIDATTGQNGLQQAREFKEHAGTTGIILTKLDGTAKGGVVVAIARELGLPIQFVGVGEKVEDLLPFNPKEFVESLFEA
jgi:fused signal recognition particle receptor